MLVHQFKILYLLLCEKNDGCSNIHLKCALFIFTGVKTYYTFFFVFSSVIENIHDGYSLLFQRKLNFLSAIQTKKDGTTATSWRRFRVHLVTRTILELF